MLQVREQDFETEELARLPRLSRARARLARIDKLFIALVIVPTIAAIFYFGVFASNVFVSESEFLVRTPNKQSTSGLGVLLKSTGFSNDGDEVYAAEEFLRSRDALKALNQNKAVARAYGSKDVSVFDRYNPLGLSGSFEDLYHYFQGKVGVQYDSTSSVTHLSVRAFTPEDAYRFNQQMLALAEDFVNRLNKRERADVFQFAEQQVQEAQLAARSAAVALASYRNTHGVVDPEEQAKEQLDMVGKLQDQLIAARMQLLQLQSIAPENPEVPVLKTRIAGLAHEVNVQMGRVAGSRRSLSETAVQYERLDLERQFAEKRLAAAMASLQDAEEEARRKQVYVERVSSPSLPDEAAGPRRLRGILATIILGIIAWGLVRLVVAGIREHHT